MTYLERLKEINDELYNELNDDLNYDEEKTKELFKEGHKIIDSCMHKFQYNWNDEMI